MNDLVKKLGKKEQRGSKPRCHWLTHGTAPEVASRLTSLVAPWAIVSPTDSWMPVGFVVTEEAQLHKATRLVDLELGKKLGEWWLPKDRTDLRTPVFDLASTCLIDGVAGLLLIEAKAHDAELKNESIGRKLKINKSSNRETSEGDRPGSNSSVDENANRKASHVTIGRAIDEACAGLGESTSEDWHISRDSHYQMSNRFAWAWKLADSGIPVVLVYLGFLRANEMSDISKPFEDAAEWEAKVRAHSAPLFSDNIWNRRWTINGAPFVPLIRSLEQPLNSQI